MNCLPGDYDEKSIDHQKVTDTFCVASGRLFHEFVNGLAQVVDCAFIPGGYRIHHAVAHVILQDHLACVIQGRAYSSQLDQNLGTVVALFHHALDFFQMADGPGKPVDHRFLVFVDMAVGMGDAVGVHIGMVVFMIMVVMMVVDMVCHGKPSRKRDFSYHTRFFSNLQAPIGDEKRGYLPLQWGVFFGIIEKNPEEGDPMAGNSSPIAVFDSGVGGISVLRELIKYLPEEEFLYFGDSANAPYGSRTTEEVRQLTLLTAERMFRRDCKALVVACNTATAAAIVQLREEYPDKIIIGIEPALKVAADRFPKGHVGIMATEVTLREEKLAAQIERFPDLSVTRIPAPGLVQLVEAGKTDHPQTQALLEEILTPYVGKLDALVLGCTHYPFVKKLIAGILGPEVQLLDGGEGTARRTRYCLEQAGLLRQGEGSIRIENSLHDPDILYLCMQLLEE